MTNPSPVSPLVTVPASPTYGAADVPADVWGLDSVIVGVLTDEQLRALAEFELGSLGLKPSTWLPTPPTGRPRVLWGYIALPGQRSAWDWSAERLRAACDAGFYCGAVQHCRRGLWTASPEQGDADGAAAAEECAAIGYVADAHCAQDDEAVANPGPSAVGSVYAWGKRYRQYGRASTYEGYEGGLTQMQEYENPYVDRYWGAMGPWDVATRSVCCRQGPTVRIGGIAYDLDRFFPDKLGGVMRLMARADLVQVAA